MSRGEKQSQTFPAESEAEQFRKLVEGSGNRWPQGWVKGRGFPDTDAADDDSPTFAEWAEKAIHRRTRASDRTKADYHRDLRLHVNPHIGHLTLNRFATDGIEDDLADWIYALRAAGLSAKTIHNVHGLASSILKQAVRARLLDANPLQGSLDDDDNAVHTEEMVFLLPAEVALILRYVPVHYRALVTLLYGTGLRWSEATALQVHDVDVLAKRPALSVRRAWKVDDEGHFYLGEPKTRRARRTLALSPELVDVLIPLVASSDPGGFVFVTPEGRPVRHNNFYGRVWRRAVALAAVCDTHAAVQLAAEAAGAAGGEAGREAGQADTVRPGAVPGGADEAATHPRRPPFACVAVDPRRYPADRVATPPGPFVDHDDV